MHLRQASLEETAQACRLWSQRVHLRHQERRVDTKSGPEDDPRTEVFHWQIWSVGTWPLCGPALARQLDNQRVENAVGVEVPHIGAIVQNISLHNFNIRVGEKRKTSIEKPMSSRVPLPFLLSRWTVDRSRCWECDECFCGLSRSAQRRVL